MAHNFTITGTVDGEDVTLGFHKCVNDEHPYERATAPFRKEQFDAAPVVGDQSLSGWWTRGQLSFHRGEGVKYYEVLQGDEILNRYQDSEGVQVFTPGEVTLAPQMRQWVNTSDEVRAVLSGDELTAWFLGLPSSGHKTLYETSSWLPGASASPVTVTGTDVASYAIATNGVDRFVATNDWGVTPTVARIESFGGLPGGTVIYEESDTAWRGLWHAKGRLWAVTSEGDLYALADSPSGTLPATLGTPLVTLPQIADETACSLTEAGTGIYLSIGTNVVYHVGLDNDGAVPTVAAPIVAAELPLGERVTAMRFYLGQLVVVTNRGVRVAVQQGDGSIVYGPHVIEWTGTDVSGGCRQIGAVGSSVYVVGEYEETGYGVFEIDLSEPFDTGLTFPYRRVWDLPGAGLSEQFGVTEHWLGVAVFGPQTLWHNHAEGLLEATGELTTGFHRLGTLDGKHFHSVTVRLAGSEGTVEVWRLDSEDDAGTLLSTVSVTDDSEPIPLGLTEPRERVALRFVLNRGTDPGEGPALLGYQLKALPAPVRQRLIRVPLMMFDVERGPTGRALGREKDAWSRLQALEGLEVSDALVSFEDRDTGEAGAAYIESVEMLVRNGPKGTARSNGFGGIVNVTLRKVGS